MTRLVIDELVRGSLGELYFKHYCRQHNYLYAKTEDIAKEFAPEKRAVTFTFGFERVPIRIPREMTTEVFRAAQLKSLDGSSYVVDFLTCSNWKENAGADPQDYAWVEVKTGRSDLSSNQQRFRDECLLRFCIFRIPNVWSPPNRIQVVWAEDRPMKHR